VSEHHFEPVRGLPGLLPPGERVLWQGAPDWRVLARKAFLGDVVAVYFAALIAWRFAEGLAHGVAPLTAAGVASTLLPPFLLALGVIALLAWATARATVYTITTRRVVLRIGVAFTLSVNVPFRTVVSAAVKLGPGGRGDIALSTGGAATFRWLLLWPHARPWRFARPEPALRAVPEAAKVAAILADAIAACQAEHGLIADATPVAAPRPAFAPPARPSVLPAE
jgi:hypothetical protein